MNNYTHYKVWDEITYPFLDFKDATVEVWEWMLDFIQGFLGVWLTVIHVNKGALVGVFLYKSREMLVDVKPQLRAKPGWVKDAQVQIKRVSVSIECLFVTDNILF